MRNKNNLRWSFKFTAVVVTFALVLSSFGSAVFAQEGPLPTIIIPTDVPTPTPTPTCVDDIAIKINETTIPELCPTSTLTPTPTPTPEDTLTFNFIKYVCSSFSDIAGNDDADVVDHSGGNYTQFSNYNFDSDGVAPHFPDFVGEVNPSEKPDGCEGSSDWDFLLSTDQAQNNNTQIVGLTNSSGVLEVPFSSLRTEIQDALTNGGELWISEVEQPGFQFAALRCYTDAVNGDNLEYLTFGQNQLPEGDIYCIAYNIATDGGDDDDGLEISGIVYNDENQNNNKDGSEEGLPGWIVNLFALGEGETLVDTTESDASGNYVFSNLDPGCYSVKEVVEADWAQTEPDVPGHYYLVALGGADCLFSKPEPTPTLVEVILSSLFIKTAMAADGYVVEVAGDAIGLNFGNFSESNDSGGGGGSRRNPTPTPTGQVLGQEDTPLTPTVAGATELPRTGASGLSILLIVVASLAYLVHRKTVVYRNN